MMESKTTADQPVGLAAGRVATAQYEQIAATSRSDLPWVANGFETYRATLKNLPNVFAWNESNALLESVGILGHSVCLRRMQSLLNVINRYDAKLSFAMRSSFERLSPAARARLILAPETIYRIWHFTKTPAESVKAACGFLNAESALDEPASDKRGRYWTALGDFYYADGAPSEVRARAQLKWAPNEPYCAPRLAQAIPIDFYSPNVAHAKETTVASDFLPFSDEEMSLVRERLEDAFDRISKVSQAAALLIEQFVRVIIPLKVSSGVGSTSERSFPGRVILQGVERATSARIAAALVHEAIHQLLYILEFEGRFVVIEPEERVKSLWTGRPLELHSFFHACFVWYGLANFWALAQKVDAFDPEEANRRMNECLKGFRGRNPVDAIVAPPGAVRGDALQVASTLQQRLQALTTSSSSATVN
ncbi:MAG: hypothetical protein JO340_11690 [Acidobacteriaceae bacterium]|nr:hypothetical protein [Acidobacteriaceae bacterium]